MAEDVKWDDPRIEAVEAHFSEWHAATLERYEITELLKRIDAARNRRAPVEVTDTMVLAALKEWLGNSGRHTASAEAMRRALTAALQSHDAVDAGEEK